MEIINIALRIHVINPSPDVTYRMQKGKTELVNPTFSDGTKITFDLTVRLGNPLENGKPDFLGEYSQGPRGDRFIYINSGVRSGQPDSPWDRRAKIKLSAIDNEMISILLANPHTCLGAVISGQNKDGSPACATVPFIESWHVSLGKV